MDVDEFICFWVLEMLLGIWDFVIGNVNNFYFYCDFGDGLFYFIFWGVDMVFCGEYLFKSGIGVLYCNFVFVDCLYGLFDY